MNKIPPTLYSRTSTGAVQIWTIRIAGDSYRTIHGQLDGKLQTTEWTRCKGKNTGKANATTDEEQCLKEVWALWKKKKESGCFENIEEIDTVLFTEPMLAKKYEDRKDKLTFPVWSSPKLDGLRMVARKDGVFTRTGKRYVSVPHIEKALESFFIANPTVILDGELYCDKFANDFNSICSLAKKTKPTAQDLEESAKALEYWIYDIVDTSASFENRYVKVVDAVNYANTPCVKLVCSTPCNHFDIIDSLYEMYIDQGYEGQMIRTNGKYENKRSTHLLKRKEFQDEEFVITGVIEGEGNRTGCVACFEFTNHLGHYFKCDVMGTREYCRDLLINKESLIGKLATVKYFNKTPDKELPRFGKVKAIRDYE